MIACVNSGGMSPESYMGNDPNLQAPVAQLEREVAELRRQLTMFMPQLPSQPLHPSDEHPEFYSEAQYRALIELSPQVVWISDAKGLATYANQYWYDLTGMTLEQTLSGGWTNVIHPEDAQVIYP